MERYAISFVAQLLEVANERLQPPQVTTVGSENPTRTRVEDADVFTRRPGRSLP